MGAGVGGDYGEAEAHQDEPAHRQGDQPDAGTFAARRGEGPEGARDEQPRHERDEASAAAAGQMDGGQPEAESGQPHHARGDAPAQPREAQGHGRRQHDGHLDEAREVVVVHVGAERRGDDRRGLAVDPLRGQRPLRGPEDRLGGAHREDRRRQSRRRRAFPPALAPEDEGAHHRRGNQHRLRRPLRRRAEAERDLHQPEPGQGGGGQGDEGKPLAIDGPTECEEHPAEQEQGDEGITGGVAGAAVGPGRGEQRGQEERFAERLQPAPHPRRCRRSHSSSVSSVQSWWPRSPWPERCSA